MKKHAYPASLFIFNFFFTAVLAAFISYALKFGNCFSAAARLPPVEQYQVMRILIYGSSITHEGDTVSAVISILDTDGNECSVIERSWNGSSLSISFVTAEFSGKKIFFPSMIYGKNTVSERSSFSFRSSGTSLYPYYNDDRQCLLFGSRTSYRDRHNLYELARFAFNPASVLTGGFSRRYIVDLSRCRTGVYYSIITGFDGTITLTEQ
jgi:hypothetical protein